jgi:alanine dehydrogenase
MNIKIGIRREDINKWEKRVPLIPSHVRELADRNPMEFRIQPSTIRIFNDADYRLAGVPVEEGLSPCPIVLALKEIPIELIEKGKAYMFFSHTAKGQSQNMPMLKRFLELGCTVIDYERMVDEKGRRVLYFGNYAGHAGMIDTLWTLGRRLEAEGTPNPFSALRPTHTYANLVEAKEAVARLASKIAAEGLPRGLDPLVVGFFGYGHVSQGAQEIFDLLPVETVRPADIRALVGRGGGDGRRLFKTVFREEDMVRPIDPAKGFDLQDYYDHPEGYRPVTEDFVPDLTALVNGIYWTPKFPKYVTKAFLRRLYGGAPRPRLRVVGDITCDINGSIECTVMPTDSESPVYVYDPIEDKAVPGFAGRGPAVLAVYNLPAELPLESSTYFSGKLKDYMPAVAAARFDRPFAECGLPDVLRRAVIVYRGELTPDFAYLAKHLG